MEKTIISIAFPMSFKMGFNLMKIQNLRFNFCHSSAVTLKIWLRTVHKLVANEFVGICICNMHFRSMNFLRITCEI